MTTLRIPRGLWEDLEESVINQDRQFLIEVARSLGLPIKDVLRKCLIAKPVLIPYDTDVEVCPWSTLSQSKTLWFPCHRKRLAPTLPCCIHEKNRSNAKLTLELADLPRRIPVTRNKILYWIDPAGIEPPLHENGSIAEGRFILTRHRGVQVAIWTKS